jgi:MFS family permease
MLTGLGAVLAPLQDELHVDRSAVAFYPALFAVGLLCIGVVGPRLVGATGRVTLGRVSLGAIAAGALLLCSGWRPATMVGAALLGLGSAAIVQLVAAGLTEQHGVRAPAALGEANALSSAASVAGPLSVAVAIGIGASWRVGYLLLPLIATATLAPLLRPPHPVERSADLPQRWADAGLPPGPMPPRWINLLLSISVEFCMIFWAADALTGWHGAGTGMAAALTALFVAGMAVVRAASRPLIGDRHPLTVTIAATAVAAGGFAIFWTGPDLLVAAVGLAVMGTGVALLYPVNLARVVASWPDRPDAAAARAALASGLAIGAAPLVLAAVADLVGLRTAFLLVPGLLLALVARSHRARHQERAAAAASERTKIRTPSAPSPL